MEEELIKHDKPELKRKLKDLENKMKKIDHEYSIFEGKRKSAQQNIESRFKKTEKLELRKLEAEKRF